MFPRTFCTLQWHVTATPDTRLHTSNRACLSWLLFIPVQTCDWPSVNKLRKPRGAVHGAEIKDFHLTAPLTLLPMMPDDYWRNVSRFIWQPFTHVLLYLHLQTCLVFSRNVSIVSVLMFKKHYRYREVKSCPVGFQLKCVQLESFVKVFVTPENDDCVNSV